MTNHRTQVEQGTIRRLCHSLFRGMMGAMILTELAQGASSQSSDEFLPPTAVTALLESGISKSSEIMLRDGGTIQLKSTSKYDPWSRLQSDSALSHSLHLTVEQQHALRLSFDEQQGVQLDLRSKMLAAESQLASLSQSDHADQDSVLLQIDRVSASRSDLEKANLKLLIAVRHVLSDDQWKILCTAPLQPLTISLPHWKAPSIVALPPSSR